MRQKQTGILGRRNSLSKGSEVETARQLGSGWWGRGEEREERGERQTAEVVRAMQRPPYFYFVGLMFRPDWQLSLWWMRTTGRWDGG